MTSIEWLVKELYTEMNMSGDGRVLDEILEQAKQMYKQEIMKAVDLPKNKRWYDAKLYNSCGEQYYQETFVSKGSDEVELPKQDVDKLGNEDVLKLGYDVELHKEISDEEIEKASWKYEVRNKFDTSFIREAFIKGCEWYREQLKQRQ